MDKDMIRLAEVISKKIPVIIDAIEKADATTEEYNKLLVNFNSSMVIYSEINNMIAARLANQKEEAQKDGTNN